MRLTLISVYDPTHGPLAKDDECSNVYEKSSVFMQ